MSRIVSVGRASGLPQMGFCGHIGRTWIDAPEALLAALHGTGGTVLREDLSWPRVEQSVGVYAYPGSHPDLLRLDATFDLAPTYGVRPLAILDYGNSRYGPSTPPGYKGGLTLTSEERTAFAAFAGYVASTAADQIADYEIWNEWNIGLGTTDQQKADGAHLDPLKYHELVSVAYAAIKSATPTARVWAGALSDPTAIAPANNAWFESYSSFPGWADVCDGFSFHHYFGFQPPEYWFWQVRGLVHRVATKAGRSLPVALTETGWFTGSDQSAVSYSEQADRYSRWPFLLACTGVRMVVFYALRDDGDSEAKEDGFGVYENDYAPKPAADVLADVLPLIHQSREAEYFTDGARHAVVLDGPARFAALWAHGGGIASSLDVILHSPSGGSVSVKTAGGTSDVITVSTGRSSVPIALHSRAKIMSFEGCTLEGFV